MQYSYQVSADEHSWYNLILVVVVVLMLPSSSVEELRVVATLAALVEAVVDVAVVGIDAVPTDDVVSMEVRTHETLEAERLY